MAKQGTHTPRSVRFRLWTTLARMLLCSRSLAAMREEDRVVRLVLVNGTTRPMRLYLRPWGSFYPLQLGESYEVRASGPSTGTLTFAQVEDGVIVTGWPGCILSVHVMTRAGDFEIIDVPRAVAPTLAICQEFRAARERDDDDEDNRPRTRRRTR
jgi:hypothetical protein